jgi:hypothetical protein
MSLEAGNRRKSLVTLAVAAGYFFSLKKIMRENLSSISNTMYSACNKISMWMDKNQKIPMHFNEF